MHSQFAHHKLFRPSAIGYKPATNQPAKHTNCNKSVTIITGLQAFCNHPVTQTIGFQYP